MAIESQEAELPIHELSEQHWLTRRHLLILPEDIHDQVQTQLRQAEPNPLDVLGKAKDKGPPLKRATAIAHLCEQMEEEGERLTLATLSQVNGLRFDTPGGAQYNAVYTAHPLDTTRYMSVGSFEKQIVTQRYWEAFRLLAALGASVIRIETNVAARKVLKLGIPTFSVPGYGKVSVHFEKGDEHSDTSVLEARLPGHATPTMPADLLWMEYEEQWRAIADARCAYGLESFALEISRRDDCQITGSFEAWVSDYKLNAGGDFADVTTVSLSLSGTFVPLAMTPGPHLPELDVLMEPAGTV